MGVFGHLSYLFLFWGTVGAVAVVQLLVPITALAKKGGINVEASSCHIESNSPRAPASVSELSYSNETNIYGHGSAKSSYHPTAMYYSIDSPNPQT
eukprot:4836816-Amphidinium_carterae.1